MAFLFLPCLYSCLWFVSHSVSPCKNEVNVVLVTIAMVTIIFIIVVVAIIILIVIIITFVIIMMMTTRARTGILAGNHNSRVESSANGDINIMNIIIIIAITLSINPPQLKQEITLRYDQLCLLCHLDLVYCLPLPAPNCQTGQK